MRTTVELTTGLLRAAKARSAERGESLKSLLSRAVASELKMPLAAPGNRPRVTLPLFGKATGNLVNPSNADLERAIADADAASPQAARRPRHSRRRTVR